MAVRVVRVVRRLVGLVVGVGLRVRVGCCRVLVGLVVPVVLGVPAR